MFSMETEVKNDLVFFSLKEIELAVSYISNSNVAKSTPVASLLVILQGWIVRKVLDKFKF